MNVSRSFAAGCTLIVIVTIIIASLWFYNFIYPESCFDTLNIVRHDGNGGNYDNYWCFNYDPIPKGTIAYICDSSVKEYFLFSTGHLLDGCGTCAFKKRTCTRHLREDG